MRFALLLALPLLRPPLSMAATVETLVNPHAYVYLDVKDASGATAHWGFQTLPPGMMKARGVSRDMFPVGQTVTISGYGAKDGTQNLGWIKKVQYADGRILQVTAEEENK